jgi:uncharacterized phage protein gp47/JayE
MTTIPDFIPPFGEDEEDLRTRIDADADPTLNLREGGYFQTSTEPVVKELARFYSALNDAIMLASPLYAIGIYLDYKAAEVGLERRSATKATGEVTFSGVDGTFIPAATRVTVPAATSEQQSIRFTTTADATIASGTAVVGIQADAAGEDGNVTATSIDYLEDSISGVTSVSNADITSGGSDEETDDELRERIFLKIRASSSSGSVSDYETWCLSIDGVSQVTVVPQWDGPYSVKCILLGPDNSIVSEAIMDEVQEYLTGAPKFASPTAPTVADGGAGAITEASLYYKVTFVDEQDGETDGGVISANIPVTSKQVSLTNIPLGPSGIVARNVYRATSTSSSAKWYRVTSGISLNDNTTTVLTDNDPTITTHPEMPKTNNTTNYDGIAPIGHRVSIDTPTSTSITVSATVSFETGFTLDGTGGTIALEDSIVAAIEEYIDSLPPGGDVIYQNVAAAFFEVDGVYDISSLLVNAGSSNVSIPDTEVATPGTITLT